jgi:hypothetical protein
MQFTARPWQQHPDRTLTQRVMSRPVRHSSNHGTKRTPEVELSSRGWLRAQSAA